jgi:hypothetical protein
MIVLELALKIHFLSQQAYFPDHHDEISFLCSSDGQKASRPSIIFLTPTHFKNQIWMKIHYLAPIWLNLQPIV